MTRKVRVKDAGSTNLLEGTSVDVSEIDAENERVREYNAANPDKTPLLEATYIPMLLGITKASLSTDSFLSAASFQETTRCSPKPRSRAKSTRCSASKKTSS